MTHYQAIEQAFVCHDDNKAKWKETEINERIERAYIMYEEGKYKDLMEFLDEELHLLSKPTGDNWHDAYNQLEQTLNEFKDDKDKQFQCMILAITMMCIFIQHNHTGPEDPLVKEIPFGNMTITVPKEVKGEDIEAIIEKKHNRQEIDEHYKKVKNQNIRIKRYENRYAIEQLSIDGEVCDHLTKKPHYLLIAERILKHLTKTNKTLISVGLWYTRAVMLHQQTLTYLSQQLDAAITHTFDQLLHRHCPELNEKIEEWQEEQQKGFDIKNFLSEKHQENTSESSSDDEEEISMDAGDALDFLDFSENTTEKETQEECINYHREFLPRLLLEYGMACHTYHQRVKAKMAFHEAKRLTGLTVELTGSLGKRTRFQQRKLAQLILKARSVLDKDTKNIMMPKDVSLQEINEDNPMLEQIDTDLNEQEHNLVVIDQCIILALCMDVKNNNPQHGLINEEMLAYIDRVHMHPNNWIVFTMCLLLRSRLQAENPKYFERSLLQLEELVAQFYTREQQSGYLATHREKYDEEETPVQVRLSYFFELGLPSMIEMENELGQRYMKFGGLKTAIAIFEKLEKWENVIEAYYVLEKPKRAMSILEEQLVQQPNNPLLWTLKGQMENNPEHLEKAWEVSNNRYARAYRQLGHYYFKNQNYEEAIRTYTAALNINSLYPRCWFALGCAYLKLNNIQGALRSFTSTIQQVPDDAEAWTNIASCHQSMRSYDAAYIALKQALKYNRTSSQIWENYLYLCMENKRFEEACYVMSNLLDLRGKKMHLNMKALYALVKELNGLIESNQRVPAAQLTRAMDGLWKKIEDKISSRGDIWNCRALYFEVLNLWDDVVATRQKQMRAVKMRPWQIDPYCFDQIAEAVIECAQAQMNPRYLQESSLDKKRTLFMNARVAIEPILKEARGNFKENEKFKTLEALHAKAVKYESSL